MTEFTIELDHQKVYTSGDIVSGRVHLAVDEKVDLSAIDVTLFGYSKSRNKVHSGQGYVTKQEKHLLFKEETTLFPPPDIQAVSKTESYTLTEGSYSYNFTFTFPGKEHKADCKVDKKFFHSHGYTKKEHLDSVALAPTYFNKTSFDNYCKIEYYLEAVVRNPSIFRFNSKATKDLMFHPANQDMTYSVNHIMDKKSILEDYEICEKKLKYASDGKLKEDGFFNRLFLSEGTIVPLSLDVEFKEGVETPVGPSKRVVKTNGHISDFIQVSLWTPSIGQSRESKKEGENGRLTLRISSIKIKLILRVRYYAVKHSRRTNKYVLLDKALDNEISLSDFEPVEDNSRSGVKGMFKFELDPLWYDCDVTDVGQSFITCNVKRDFELQVALGVASSEDITNEVVLKAVGPIILQKLEDVELNRPDGYGNPPPEYGDEKNSEPMEWGV